MPSHNYEAGKYARTQAIASLLSTPGVQTSGHHIFHNLKGKTVMRDQEPREFNSGSSDKCPNFSELSCLSTSWGQKSPPCTVALLCIASKASSGGAGRGTLSLKHTNCTIFIQEYPKCTTVPKESVSVPTEGSGWYDR